MLPVITSYSIHYTKLYEAVEDIRQAKIRTLALWSAPLGEKFQTAQEFQKLADLMLASTEKLNKEISQKTREKTEIET